MLWLITGVILVAVFWYRGSRPFPNEVSDGSLPRLLRLLLGRGVHRAGIRGTLAVCMRDTPRQRVIFEKWVMDDGSAGFDAIVPRAPWTDTQDISMRATFDKYGMAYREEGGRHPGLRLRLGRDFGGAQMVTRIVFEDTLGARVSRDCVAFFHDVMLKNAPEWTGVDAPDDNWG